MENIKLPDPILITGCARSGTSMVAGIIHLCGAFGGKMSGATRNNEKGMFENSKIREQVVKPYLRSLKVDPMGQYPLPDVHGGLAIPSDWREKTEEVMLEDGYKAGPWMYKGAKMALAWPVWHYAFPDAKWIIVRRKTTDIISSCMKTSFMAAFTTSRNWEAVGVDNEADGWKWWVHQHEDRFREMIEAGLNVKIIWPEKMVLGDYKEIYQAVKWLDLEWNSEALSFVDPKLWKARKVKELVRNG